MSDQLDRFVPALSATSDMPSAPSEADPTSPAPLETPDAPPPTEPAQSPEAPALSESVQPAPEPEEEPREPRGVGKALAEKDARIAEEARRVKRLEAEAEALRRTLEQISSRIPDPKAEATPEPAPDPRPSREQFNSPEEYDEALLEWGGRASARAAEAYLEKQAKAREEAEKQAAEKAKNDVVQQEALVKWNEAKSKFMEEHYDYSEVAERDDLSISQTMAHLIVNAPDGRGPSIAYHLGKNPQEATRISQLPPAMQIFEMGRLAAEIARPKPNVSRAPEPARPVRSSAAASAERSNDELSMEEYASKRLAALREQQRRPGSPPVH